MNEIFSNENLIILSQLALSILLGSLLGVERQISRKTAGIRTYALVSLGSTLFTAMSVMAVSAFGGHTNFDPGRIAGQVVVGIGFIGGGLIIVHGDHVTGVTTAAGLWLAAAVGMAVGFGFYTISIFATILALVVFIVLWFVEKWIVEFWSSTAPDHFKKELKEALK